MIFQGNLLPPLSGNKWTQNKMGQALSRTLLMEIKNDR